MLEELKKSALENIKKVTEPKALGELRVKYLGRKGEVTRLLRELKNMAIEKRREAGPIIQGFKKELEEIFEEKMKELDFNLSNLKKSNFDITKPGQKTRTGHIHPLSKVEEEIRQIFLSLNFSVVEGPELETEYYNFDALNIPAGHPARDMWDTFWIKEEGLNAKNKKDGHYLMRTHTSPVQIRYMEKHEPPFQIIVPGKVFRYEATDMSHETNFYQIEGLMVGKDVSLANFKYIIEAFFKKFFSQEIDFRYRPSYFPFVEPGLEVDIKFKNKWLEIMGAGMVHHKVFEAVKYNPYEWQGFAFGMSLERLTMIKYNIPDIRLFYSGDLRFINQF